MMLGFCMRFMEKIKNGISNLAYFFPAIWNFYTFDHHFTTILLYKTYKRILDKWELKRIYIGQIQEVMILREIVENLEKGLEDEEYLPRALELIKENYFRFWN